MTFSYTCGLTALLAVAASASPCQSLSYTTQVSASTGLGSFSTSSFNGTFFLPSTPPAGSLGHTFGQTTTSASLSQQTTVQSSAVIVSSALASSSSTSPLVAPFSAGLVVDAVSRSTSSTKGGTSTAKTSTASAAAVTSQAAIKPAIAAVANVPSSCTVSAYSAVSSAIAKCTALVVSSLSVPAGVTLDFSSLKSGSSVTFTGTTTFGYKEWAGPLVQFSGASLTITGAAGSILDGQGALYWDGQGSNGGKTKPKFFKLSKVTSHSVVKGITIKNSPVQVFSISGCSDITLDSITVNDSAGDTGGGHNTDAFDVGTSTGVTITNAKVYNQDDCLAINSGTNIVFSGGYCSGGHGLSIGSVGGRSDNDVENVLITNSQIVNSANGVRVKTVSGATGLVNNVTYSGITLSGITTYGVVIEQDYQNGNPTGKPTSGVPITDLTLNGVTGTVASGAQDVYILCASCSKWTWKGVSITGGKAKKTCEGVPTGASC